MTLQIYSALASLIVGFLVNPSHGFQGEYIAQKAHNKVVSLSSIPKSKFQVRSAIAYGGAGNHVEFQIVGETENAADLITILIVVKTEVAHVRGSDAATHEEIVVGDAFVACTASKNGVVDTSFCPAAFTALKMSDFKTDAQDFELKSTQEQVKKLGAKLRAEGKFSVGGTEWKVVTVNTLDLTKTNQVPTLLFIGKKEFTGSKHGSVLILATFDTQEKKFTAKTAAFAANGVIVEAPTEQVIKDATDKTKITAALASLPL